MEELFLKRQTYFCVLFSNKLLLLQIVSHLLLPGYWKTLLLVQCPLPHPHHLSFLPDLGFR